MLFSFCKNATRSISKTRKGAFSSNLKKKMARLTSMFGLFSKKMKLYASHRATRRWFLFVCVVFTVRTATATAKVYYSSSTCKLASSLDANEFSQTKQAPHMQVISAHAFHRPTHTHTVRSVRFRVCAATLSVTPSMFLTNKQHWKIPNAHQKQTIQHTYVSTSKESGIVTQETPNNSWRLHLRALLGNVGHMFGRKRTYTLFLIWGHSRKKKEQQTKDQKYD